VVCYDGDFRDAFGSVFGGREIGLEERGSCGRKMNGCHVY